MKNLYLGLKARIVAQDTTSRIKFIGKQQGQLEKMKNGKAFGFQLPALLFKFRNPNDVVSVGGGVQVFDPVFIEVEILHEFYNDSDTGTSINLDVYDEAGTVHGWLEGHAIKGANYGSSELNRISVEEDEEHDQVYSYKAIYQCTWVDNSTTYPRGGYEIDPILEADITAEFLEADVPTVTASVASLDFGNVGIGESVTRTFTISAEHLDEEPVNDDPLIISTSNGHYLITLDTSYRTRIEMSPTDGVVDETTITVQFTPTSGGAVNGSILYGVPGINGEISLVGVGVSYLLQENGDFLLQENDDKILL